MNGRWFALLAVCLALVFALLATSLYVYGAKPVMLLLALVALACPVVVAWVYWRFGRETSELPGLSAQDSSEREGSRG